MKHFTLFWGMLGCFQAEKCKQLQFLKSSETSGAECTSALPIDLSFFDCWGKVVMISWRTNRFCSLYHTHVLYIGNTESCALYYLSTWDFCAQGHHCLFHNQYLDLFWLQTRIYRESHQGLVEYNSSTLCLLHLIQSKSSKGAISTVLGLGCILVFPCILLCFNFSITIHDKFISFLFFILKVARIPSCVVYFAWNMGNYTLNRALWQVWTLNL